MIEKERIRVLIVDDDPSILTMLARIATAMGFDVIRASTAHEAIIEIDNADILIVDLKLNGDMAGGELVLDTWLSRRSGPCCVLSGHIDRKKEIDLFIRGADNVLWKPIPHAAIQASLNRYKRHVKDARLRVKLLHEVEALKLEISELRKELKEDVKTSRRRTMILSASLGFLLLVVLGIDASGTTIATLIGKLISIF